MTVENLISQLRDAAKFTLADTLYSQAADKLEEIAAEVERLRIKKQHWTVRDEKAEAALAEKDKEIEELRELVGSAENIFRHCTVSDGVCCCGDNMESHPSPMSCGHTPVDHGAYQVDLWIQARNAGGTDD